MSKKKKKNKNQNSQQQKAGMITKIDMPQMPDNHPRGEIELKNGSFNITSEGNLFRPYEVEERLRKEYPDFEELIEQENKIQDGDIDFSKARDFLFGAYCYGYDFWFKGKVSSINGEDIVFEKLYGWFMYSNGDGDEGTIDHVHIFEADSFRKEEISVGDCVSFSAVPYPYRRSDGGCDFGLKNCWCIKKIESYELPTEEELKLQAVNHIICELCLCREQCYGFCIANQEWKEQMTLMLMGEDSSHPDAEG